MKSVYEAEITPSAISRSVSRGTLPLRRALQILAICGVSGVEIVGAEKKQLPFYSVQFFPF